MQEKNDINIDGFGDIFAGEYNNVEINGMGKIKGDIISSSLEIDGKSSGFGNITSDCIEINGHFKNIGDITFKKKFEVNGYCKVEGGVSGKKLNINGRFICSKGVNIDNFMVDGMVKVIGDLECETVVSNGKLDIYGLLSADDIKINLGIVNNIKQIGGEKLVVKKSSKQILGIFASFIGKTPKLICEEIEVEDIYLENTDCKVVRGNNIEIGVGCSIDKIEYSGELKISSNSIVKEKVRI